MDEIDSVLQVIRDELEKQSPQTIGPFVLTNKAMSFLHGQAKLSVTVHHDPDDHPSVAHCHIVVEMGDPPNCLDACVMGIHSDRREALADAARTWIDTAAGPILSLLHGRPIMNAVHFHGPEPWGVSGCHGFVGAVRVRFLDQGFDVGALADAPLYDYAAEMAPPGIVHLAKVTLDAKGAGGWQRNLEVDGHAAFHADSPWKAGLPAPSQGILSRFAVFHYADQPGSVEARRDVDDAIRRFVSAFQATEDLGRTADLLRNAGVDRDLVYWVDALTPAAFGRMAFKSLGVTFPPDYVRITREGTTESGLMLMHHPVFARSMSLYQEFIQSNLVEAVKKLVLTTSELRAINEALHAGSKPENLRLLAPIIPDPDASPEAIEHAIRQMEERPTQELAAIKTARPWWKFW